MIQRALSTLSITAVLSCTASMVFADDLFQVTAGGVSVSANSLPDLLTNLADTTGDFSSLEGTAFTGTITYAGVANAIAVSFDPNGGGAGVSTITITSLLGTDASTIPIFSEADGDLGSQLEDFFLKNAPDTIANFQQALAAQTPTGVVSGNPMSAAARMMNYRKHRFGIDTIRYRSPAVSKKESRRAEALIMSLNGQDAAPAKKKGVGGSFAMTTSGTSVTSGNFSGYGATIEPSLSIDFGDTASLVFGFPIGYASWEGSHSGSIGLQIDVPIQILHHKGEASDKGFSPDVRWSIVPGGGTLGAFSFDLAQGGLFWNAGVTTVVEIYDENKSIAVTLGYMHLASIQLEYDDYIFDYGADEDFLQVGFRMAHKIGKNVSFYGGTTYSRFINVDAFTTDWFSPNLGFAWTLKKGGLVTLGFEGDFAGSDWKGYGAQLSFVIPF
jgi:hypothetical protein